MARPGGSLQRALSAAVAVSLSGCGLLLDLGGGDPPPRDAGAADADPDGRAASDAGAPDAEPASDAETSADAAPPFDETACDDAHEGAILCESFESAELAGWSPRGDVGAVAAPVYRGTGALRGTSTLDSRVAAIVRSDLPSVATGELFVRAYYWLPASSPAAAIPFLHIEEIAPPHAFVELRFSDGALTVGYGTDARVATNALSGAPMPRDRWVCIELRIVISATAGVVEALLDGTSASMLSAIDTLPGGGYATLYSGFYDHVGAEQLFPTELFIDELVVDDQRVGCDGAP